MTTAPKRPLSAFFLYVKARKEEVKKDHPEMSVTELGSFLGKAWRELSEDQKKPYDEQAKEAKADYLKALEKHKETDPDYKPTRKKHKKRKPKEEPPEKEPAKEEEAMDTSVE